MSDAPTPAERTAAPGQSAPALAALRIVLIRTSHPGNIGATARAMLTMGLTRLALVAPRRFPDPEAEAMASGATSVLDNAQVTGSLDEALAGTALTIGLTARPREFAGRVLDVRAAAVEAIARTADGDVAIVFGTEMSGLTNEELARCTIVATIPSNPVYGSLNLAAAVQVMAYELRVAAGQGEVWRAQRFFSIPGIGREVILAVERSDFPVIKAITIYVAVATMVFNLLADLMYKAVDPRVQLK